MAAPPSRYSLKGSVVAGLVAVLCLAFTPSASASSIVFVRDGDIFLVTPDGSREHRVTNGGRFTDVTQADDGRIFASDHGVLYSFAPDGTQLAGPTGTGDTFDLDVNPTGTQLAFWYLTSGGGRYTVINSDGSPAPEWDDQNGWYPTWIRNDLLLLSNGAGYLETARTGLGTYYRWTGNPQPYRFHSSAITRANDRLVAVIRDYDDTGPWAVAHYSNTSEPPVDDEGHPLQPPPEDEQPVHRCTSDYGGVEPSHPSFSPDGAMIAWELPGAVKVQPVLDLNSCTQPPGGFSIAGAKSPDWGPADVPAAVVAPPPGEELLEAATYDTQKLGKALKKGFKLEVNCSEACTATGKLRHKGKVVAKDKEALGSGNGTLTLKFTKKGKKRLKRVRKAKLKIVVKVTNAQGERETAKGKVTLKR